MINKSDAKNTIAPMVTRHVPMSETPAAIFFEATGSISSAVTLYMTEIAMIFSIGISIRDTMRRIPKIPTIPLIDPMHLIKSSTVSAVNPPTMGINASKEYFAVPIIRLSEVCVISPCTATIPDISVSTSPVTKSAACLRNLDKWFT